MDSDEVTWNDVRIRMKGERLAGDFKMVDLIVSLGGAEPSEYFNVQSTAPEVKRNTLPSCKCCISFVSICMIFPHFQNYHKIRAVHVCTCTYGSRTDRRRTKRPRTNRPGQTADGQIAAVT